MKRIALFFLVLAAQCAFAQSYGRIDFSLQNAQGQAIAGATVTVFTQSACGAAAGAAATLYPAATGGIPLTQPLITDAFGHTFAYTLPGCVTILYNSPYTGVLTYADQNVFAGTSGNYVSSVTATPQTIAGALNAPVLNYIVNAAQFSGSDWAAKVNTADAALGTSGGEIDVNLSAGTTATTQLALSAGHNLKFTQIGVYTVPGVTLLGSNIVDLGSSTLKIPAYSAGPTAGLFMFYSGTTVASNVIIENGVLDGNWANTPSANTCLYGSCRPAIKFDNNNNAIAVHDVTIKGVTFQNWNNPAIQSAANFPLPYNIYILDNSFINFGTYVTLFNGFDHNLVLRGNTFKSWGVGLTINDHADPITTYDPTGYAGTSMFDVDVSNNIFDNTVLTPQAFGFVAEFNGGGTGWTTNFTFTGNHMQDNGTGTGGELSGNFVNATISGNVWSTQGGGEVSGSHITVGQNAITNGSVVISPSSYFSSDTNSITGNVISIPGLIGLPGSGTSQKGIYFGGFQNETWTLTKAIRQTLQSFAVNGDALTCSPQTTSGTPPQCVLSGTFSGGASNGFQNWAFTLAGATNYGNNGTYIIAASTGTSLTFVKPLGVSETLPTGATLTSSANTTSYVGTSTFGSFNGLAGTANITVTGFTNTGNNSTTLPAIANTLTAVATTNATGVSETHAGAMVIAPSLSNTAVVGNSVNLTGASGACAGIFAGFGDGGMQGTISNVTVANNVITGNPFATDSCAGIGIAASPTTPQSSGIEILHNNISNIAMGIYDETAASGYYTDLTVAGNKMVNVPTSYNFPNGTPSVYRNWDNVTSATQTSQTLNGGVTINASGYVTAPLFFGTRYSAGNLTNPAVGLIMQNSAGIAGNYAAIAFQDANYNGQGFIGMQYGAHTAGYQGTFFIEPTSATAPKSFTVNPNGYTGTTVNVPNMIYTKAGTVLPTCASGIVGAEAAVGDATALTPGTAYVPSAGSPGSDTVRVQCTLTGSTYAWQTL